LRLLAKQRPPAGWTTELFAQVWAAPDLKYFPSMITDDVVVVVG
jgi:hypothetical protein